MLLIDEMIEQKVKEAAEKLEEYKKIIAELHFYQEIKKIGEI